MPRTYRKSIDLLHERCEQRHVALAQQRRTKELLDELDWHIFRRTRPKHFDTTGPHCQATREILALKTTYLADRKISATLTSHEWAKLLACTNSDVAHILRTRGPIRITHRRGRPPRKG